MLLITDESGARAVLIATVVAGAVAEVVVTVRGRGSVREALAIGRRGETTADRGTKQVLVLAMVGGFFAAAWIARDAPALRAGANTWATFALGVAVLVLGIVLRVWSVASLGRFFRREVTVEPGQTVHTSGPYRFVRHPAYAGDLLIVFGFGLAWGSWLGAAVGTAIALVGHLPRIRVEEAELERGLGAEYEAYAHGRARLVPGLW